MSATVIIPDRVFGDRFHLEEIDLATLVDSSIRGKQYAVAFLAWMLYEYYITIDQSVDLFWNRNWTHSKTFFMTNRYAALLTLSMNVAQLFIVSPSVTFCKLIAWLQFVGSLLLIVVLTLSMLLRVRAMWIHSRPIVIITTFLFILNILSYIIILAYMQSTAIIAPAAPPFTGCSFQPTFRHAYITFIMSILFETFVIFVTILKSWPLLRDQQFKLPISTLLLKDGLAYFISIVSVHIVIVFTGFYADFTTAIQILMSIPSLAVTGVACNRMFLRLQATLLAKDTISFGSRALHISAVNRRRVDTGADISIANDDRWTVDI